MLDGTLNQTEQCEESLRVLRETHKSRVVNGDRIPEGMAIQGVDVVDLNQSLVSHQVGLKPEIDAVAKRSEQPCIVVFAPVSPVTRLSGNFHDVSNPHRYAVVSPKDAMRLLGNTEQYAGLRNSVQRRTAPRPAAC